MLKDYSDFFDLNSQASVDSYNNAYSYLDDYPCFYTYGSARRWVNNVPNGIYLRDCPQSKLVSQNKIVLFDSIYFVLPYLAKQEFLALLKSKKF